MPLLVFAVFFFFDMAFAALMAPRACLDLIAFIVRPPALSVFFLRNFYVMRLRLTRPGVATLTRVRFLPYLRPLARPERGPE